MIDYLETFLGVDPGSLDTPAGYLIAGIILVCLLSNLLRILTVFFEGWFGR